MRNMEFLSGGLGNSLYVPAVVFPDSQSRNPSNFGSMVLCGQMVEQPLVAF